MRYGLELPCGGDEVAVGLLVDLGVLAERSGWDGVFFEDYLVYYRGDDPPTFDPWMVGAAIAVRTRDVRIGTTVTGLLLHDPVKLAREALTLDHLSAGRAVLGVGLGDPGDRGALITTTSSEGKPRAELMDERLDLLLALLAAAPVGEHGVRFRPGRVSPSTLPVWVGGSSEAGAVARRAARADGIVPYKLTDTDTWSDFTADEIKQLAANIRAHRVDDKPFDVAIGGSERRVDENAERELVRAAVAGGATWWLEFVPSTTPDEMRQAIARGPVRA